MITKVIRVVIKPYTNQDLALLFNCSSRTIRRDIQPFLHELGKRNGHRWSIPQIEIILNKLGRPYETIELESQPGILIDNTKAA